MNKNIIFSVTAVCITILIIAYMYIGYLKVEALNVGSERMPMDKFTTCLKTIMSESRQSNKAISGNEASEICKNMFMKDK